MGRLRTMPPIFAFSNRRRPTLRQAGIESLDASRQVLCARPDDCAEASARYLGVVLKVTVTYSLMEGGFLIVGGLADRRPHFDIRAEACV